MSEALNLKEIEKRAYLAYSNDGLLDVFLGAAVIAFGVGMALDAAQYVVAAPIFFFALWGMTKKWLTAPRIGYVTFSPRRQGRLGREKHFFAVFFSITAGLGAVMFWLVQDGPPFVREHIGLLVLGSLGLIGIGGLSGLAWWKQIPRYYGYALAVLVVVVIGPLLSLSPSLYLILPGGVMFLLGVVVLIRFLRRYPCVTLTESSDVR